MRSAPPRSTRSIWPGRPRDALVLGATLLLWLLILLIGRADLRNASDESLRTTSNLVRTLVAQVGGLVGTLDVTLRFGQALYTRDSTGFEFGPWAASQGEGLIANATFIGPDGFARADRDGPLPVPLDFRDHPGVRPLLADHSVDRLVIGPTVTGRLLDRQVVTFARPLFEATGGFAGILVADVDVATLENLFRALDFPSGRIRLVGRDGYIRASVPDLGEAGGTAVRGLAELAFRDSARTISRRVVSPIDGTEIFVSVRRVAGYALVVSVAQPVAVALAVVHDQGRVHLAAGLLLTALILVWWVLTYRLQGTRAEAARARLQATRDLEALIAILPGAVVRSGPGKEGAWLIAYHSPSLTTVMGLPEPDGSANWLRRWISREDMLRVRASLAEALAGQTSTVEFRFCRAEGRSQLIQSRNRANITPSGAPEVISILTDVTRERELLARLAQSEKLAQLGELATGMAHELNQPLASISLAAENALNTLGRASPNLPRAQGKLQAIVEEAMRAASIIDHMRIFGRMGDGQSGPVALADIFAKVAPMLRSKLRASNVRLRVELPADLPPVLAQFVPLEQVALNLIGNACDAYGDWGDAEPAEDRVISVRAEVHAGRVGFSVQDRAGGIPENLLPRVFEPFFTTKPAGKGTGLGLSISFGIVTECGGEIVAENRDGGARFTVSLPLAPEAAAAA